MKILRYAELKPAKGIPWSNVHLRRLEEEDKFPRRLNLGEATVGWVESEIDEWLEQRVKARDAMRECPPRMMASKKLPRDKGCRHDRGQ